MCIARTTYVSQHVMIIAVSLLFENNLLYPRGDEMYWNRTTDPVYRPRVNGIWMLPGHSAVSVKWLFALSDAGLQGLALLRTKQELQAAHSPFHASCLFRQTNTSLAAATSFRRSDWIVGRQVDSNRVSNKNKIPAQQLLEREHTLCHFVSCRCWLRLCGCSYQQPKQR